MGLNLLLIVVVTMATVVCILFRLLISGHKQQIIAKDKEIDFFASWLYFSQNQKKDEHCS